MNRFNNWSTIGEMQAFSPADNDVLYFWPQIVLLYYTTVANVFGVSKDIMVTDFGITKHVNTTGGSNEPTKIFLVEMSIVEGQNYFNGLPGTPPTFKQEYLLHNNIQFNNTRFPNQYSRGLKIHLKPECVYAYKFECPTFATNPTNVYCMYQMHGYYMDINQ